MSLNNNKMRRVIATAAIGAMAFAPINSLRDKPGTAHIYSTVQNTRTDHLQEIPYTLQKTVESDSQDEAQDLASTPNDTASNGIGGPMYTATYAQANGQLPCAAENTCHFAMGLASYGSVEESGGTTHNYTFSTNALMGNAVVNQMSAQSYILDNNGQFQPTETYGATLQLNAILQIANSNGTFDYWVQNVALFAQPIGVSPINSPSLLIDNEIWDLTKPFGSTMAPATFSNQSCAANNGVSTYNNGGGCVIPNFIPYSLPSEISLLMSVQLTNGTAVISFYYSSGFPNSNIGIEPTETQYSQTAVSMPGGIKSASFISQPAQSGIGAELVWGGPGGGSDAHFNSMSSTMNLYYEGTLGCCLSSRPQVWRQLVATQDWSEQTGESTDDLTVIPSGTGIELVVGNPNPGNMQIDYLPQPLTSLFRP